MAIVQQILADKGSELWSVAENSTVYDALRLMADKNIGSVLVLNEQGELSGIFSERDYARKVILQGKRSADTLVKEIMSPQPQSITPDTRIETCMELMTRRRFRHLPVLDGDRLVGLISIGDIVKAIIRNQEEIIREMEGYIRGEAGF